MAIIDRRWDVAAPAQRLWQVAADPARFGDWLTLHRSWQGAPPPRFRAGLRATAVLALLDIPLTVAWTVRDYDPPRRVALSGTSAAGIAVVIDLAVSSAAHERTSVAVRVELTGQLVDGAFGPPLERATRIELDRSLSALQALVGA